MVTSAQVAGTSKQFVKLTQFNMHRLDREELLTLIIQRHNSRLTQRGNIATNTCIQSSDANYDDNNNCTTKCLQQQVLIQESTKFLIKSHLFDCKLLKILH